MSRIDPVLVLLGVGWLLSAAALIGVSLIKPENAVLQTTLAGSMTAFSGALFLRVKPSKGDPGDETTATTTTVTKTPPVEEATK